MKRSELLFSAIRLPLDYLVLLLAASAAYFARYLPAIQEIRPVIFNLPYSDYFSIASLIAIGWLVIFALGGLYRMGATGRFTEELGRIFVACSAGLALVLAVMVFSRYLFDSRFIILVTWAASIIFISIERLIILIIQRQLFKLGIGAHRVIVVGDGKSADILINLFKNKPTLGFIVVDHVSKFDQETSQKLLEFVKQDKFDEIIQINPNSSLEQTNELIDFADKHHITFKYAADLLGTQLTNLDVRTIAGMPVVEVKRTRLDGWGRIYKRIFDICGALVLIIVTSPIMLITAIVIKLSSKGPTLFCYKRIGQYGEPFKYCKFRSMIDNAHKYRFDKDFIKKNKNVREGSPMMKFDNDPRITKVGKVIRRTSIDELAELFLVLSGKMSLVGPRPHEVEEVSKYQKHHKKVLALKPGITGLAQVSGRSDLNFEDEVKLDIFYIENWSIALDIQIILKTPMAVIKRRQTS